MEREVNKLLADIHKSIVLAEKYLQNIPTLSAYKNDLKTIDAVERRLAIVGEALWKADKLDNLLIISDKRKIIALRHILVHDYDLIDDDSIWIICKKHLPVLRKEVELLLNIS